MFKSKEPLGLPRGSVRAILAIIPMLTVCVLAFLDSTAAQVVTALASGAAGYYFGGRQNKAPAPEETS